MTLEEIKKNKIELEEIRYQLEQKKKLIDVKDEQIAQLEARIDDKFN